MKKPLIGTLVGVICAITLAFGIAITAPKSGGEQTKASPAHGWVQQPQRLAR